MINRIERAVKKIISPGRDPVLAVYVFGSYAKGQEKPESDIDLALVFSERFYNGNPFKALQKAELLGTEISRSLHKTVDVVILNGSSLVFACHAVKEGVCIYGKDTAGRILYEVTLENKYQDFVPFIRELRDAKRGALIGRN